MNSAGGSTRRYDMSRRSASAARTRQSVIDATEHLASTGPLSDVTLSAIADKADVTVQTVLRHFDSRSGCFDAVRERVVQRVEEQRGGVQPGDVTAAVTALVAHYEYEGRLILNLLSQEGDADPIAADVAAQGRAYHRNWVRHCFGPLINTSDAAAVDALVCATDLYVWKLLRLDLQRPIEHVKTVIEQMVRAQLEDA
jgi:AcrR family transcriptional regulator